MGEIRDTGERPFADELRSRIVPVVDVMAGRAVRAVQGRRSEYRPLESVLVPGSDPVDLANALFERHGYEELYVADLDALQGGQPQFELLKRIADSPVRLLLDLGIGMPDEVERAVRELSRSGACFVLATEASPDADAFAACLAELKDPAQAALGLDYQRGRFRTKQPATEVATGTDFEESEAWIDAALRANVETVVVLDLDRVGSDRGFAWPAGFDASPSRDRFRRKVSGGGIRSRADILDAFAAGCDAILVGSALHDGRILPASIDG